VPARGPIPMIGEPVLGTLIPADRLAPRTDRCPSSVLLNCMTTARPLVDPNRRFWPAGEPDTVTRTGFWLSLFRFQGATSAHRPGWVVGADTSANELRTHCPGSLNLPHRRRRLNVAAADRAKTYPSTTRRAVKPVTVISRAGRRSDPLSPTTAMGTRPLVPCLFQCAPPRRAAPVAPSRR